MVEVNTESNLIRHARSELQILGCNEEDIAQMCSIVQAFADVGPSGGQAAWMIPILFKLLCFENLTPLSNNPNYWIEVGPGIWQSTRRSEAFSKDRGRSYYLLSEGGSEATPYPIHISDLENDNGH